MAESALLAEREITVYEPSTRPEYVPGYPVVIRFIHFNDVYHVEYGSQEPVGGIARFKTVCNYYQNDERFRELPRCETFFSGDAFNPSLESSVTKGKHMVPILKSLGTTVACLGNHDLDFGVDQFEYLASLCDFPWLCSNVLDPSLGADTALGHCRRSFMINASDEIKIGVIGLVEKEWLDTINSLPPNLTFIEPELVARELAEKLRADGAELVVALTHQRQPNDIKLAEQLSPGTVDFILGGHDHFYAHEVVNGTHILRSGTDFRQISYVECLRKQGSEVDGNKDACGSVWDFRIVRQDVVASIPEDPAASEMVEQITHSLKSKLEKPIGYTAAPLDARFTTVRLKESNLGNFVCDIMRFHYAVDCCIMAAGTIRGDQVYPPGVIRLRDIMNCFPFEDPCVVVGLRGRAIAEALENGVSKYPALEGRFPQVSGITFAFDPARPPGGRCFDICIQGQPIDPDHEYTLVTREYMARGKDGFTSLTLDSEGGTARSIVGDEEGMLISTLLRQYFMSLKVLGRWKNWGAHLGQHWDGIHDGLHELHPVRDPVPQKKPENIVVFRPDANGHPVTSLAGEMEVSDPLLKDMGFRAAKAQHVHSDSEESGNTNRIDLPAISANQSQRERELVIIRKVVRKWWRLAGLPGHPSTCDAKNDEFGVHWTKGICPRVEGRIRIVGSAKVKD
ncbi:hypothetical protein M433DRAFT_156197 [Acidomyces richmondensis BFW]|nr:MAG: hypothetical protein FE78DRAFT_87335 [Acidomyces sp. 'richmondensis']KYG43913.1 hypothetical protein M433DRAFT_156197 [Acidomyces richmondensis BFW]